MNKIKQNKIAFTLILSSIVIVFSSLTILSLPVLFNYKSKVTNIEKNFYKSFKIYLNSYGKILYNCIIFIYIMNKIKQNKITFTLILAAISIIFSSLTILCLPVLFNYKSKVDIIEKNFSKNFKIYLK